MDELLDRGDAAQSASKGSKREHFPEKKNEWLIVNPYLILGVVGASFGLAWFFSVLITPSFMVGFSGDDFLVEFTHIVFAATLFCAYGFIWICSNWFQSHRGIMLIIATISATSSVWGIAESIFGPVAYFVASAGTGIGVAFAMALWIEFVCFQLRGQIRPAIASALALSMLLCSGLHFVDSNYQSIGIIALALISVSIYLFLRFSFSLMDDMPCILAKDSDTRLQITWRPSLLTVMASVAQGFALYCLMKSSVYGFSISAALCLFSFVLFVLLFVDSTKRLYLKESFIRRLFLPVLAACILPLSFLPEELCAVACIFAFLFSLLPYSSAIFATCEHIARCNLSAIRVFSWGRLSSTAGLLAGLLVGYLAFTSNAIGPITLPVFVVMVVMFFILVSATVSTKSYYPGEENDEPAKVSIGSKGELVADYGRGKTVELGVDCFNIKCDSVAKKYGLSKRQTEVLHLLAKGRNAEYIQNQLVISPHTAKAHIYNIYQKTGSHSRQDIIDLVENMPVDEALCIESR